MLVFINRSKVFYIKWTNFINKNNGNLGVTSTQETGKVNHLLSRQFLFIKGKVMRKISKEQFIARANKIYNNFYDYSKVVWFGLDSKVLIICPKHGEFEKNAGSHCAPSRPQGCQKCGKEKIGAYKRFDSKKFILLAEEKHGNEYSYERVEYINIKTKVEIFCKIHKKYFSQTPDKHLVGQGCPLCRHTKMIKTRRSRGSFKTEIIKNNFDKYRVVIRKITRKEYKKYKDIINPKKLKIGRHNGEHQVDHIFPVSEGFKQNIPPYIVANMKNLQILTTEENRKKSNKLIITKQELHERYFDEN